MVKYGRKVTVKMAKGQISEQGETMGNAVTEEAWTPTDNRVFLCFMCIILAFLLAIVVTCSETEDNVYDKETAASSTVEDVLSAEELSTVVYTD